MAAMTLGMTNTRRKSPSFKTYKNPTYPHPFCEHMRYRRDELGISYKTLAEKVGSSSGPYLSSIEQGKWVISIEIGLSICQILDIPIHLCIDYIAVREMERMKLHIQEKYVEWLELVPDNVLNKMLEDEESLEVHNRLTK